MSKSSISRVFTDYRQLEVLMLGIFSGMPLSVLYNSLSAWLTDAKVGIAVITTFAIARLSYSLKPLWSPAVDYFNIPVLHRLGHRKSWMVLCAASISLILFAMSFTSPGQSIEPLYLLAIALGFFSATFDIVFDAFRIEKFEKEEQGIAAANSVLGYRIGMVISGAGALYFAHITNDWPLTFLVMGAIYALSIFIIFVSREEIIERDRGNGKYLDTIKVMIFNPLWDFLGRKDVILIIPAVIFFKLGDAFLGIVSMPFYLELGFDKGQIAGIVKGWGLLATLMGTFVGGFVVYRIGNFKGMIITGIAQSVTNVAFIWLNHQGPDPFALAIAIFIENFFAGMGSAALVAYLSMLCNKKYSATQYALLTSLAGLASNTIVAKGGSLVLLLGWDLYFAMTVALGFPAVFLFMHLNKNYK